MQKKHEPEIIIRKCADSIKYAKTDIKQQKNCLNGLFLPHKKKYKTSLESPYQYNSRYDTNRTKKGQFFQYILER